MPSARFARFSGLPRALLFSSGYAANLGILAALCDRARRDIRRPVEPRVPQRWRAALARHLHALSAPRPGGARGAARCARRRPCASSPPTRSSAWMATSRRCRSSLAALRAPRRVARARRCAWHRRAGRHAAAARSSISALRSPRIVYMATLGKALGGYGAFVAAPTPSVIDWLVQKARTYVFSTALPPDGGGGRDRRDRPARRRTRAASKRLHDRIARVPRRGCRPSPRALRPRRSSRWSLGDAARALAASATSARARVLRARDPPAHGSRRDVAPARLAVRGAHERADVEAPCGRAGPVRSREPPCRTHRPRSRPRPAARLGIALRRLVRGAARARRAPRVHAIDLPGHGHSSAVAVGKLR